MCIESYGPRHRWKNVDGVMATRDHYYTECKCQRCGVYESEIR